VGADQPLPEDLRPGRSQRRAEGKLSAPGDGLAEVQIGDIGTGDQEDEADRAAEQPEHRTRATGYLLGERNRTHAPTGVESREFTLQSSGDAGELRIRSVEGTARCQPAYG
jgi:hypothetical protein